MAKATTTKETIVKVVDHTNLSWKGVTTVLNHDYGVYTCDNAYAFNVLVGKDIYTVNGYFCNEGLRITTEKVVVHDRRLGHDVFSKWVGTGYDLYEVPVLSYKNNPFYITEYITKEYSPTYFRGERLRLEPDGSFTKIGEHTDGMTHIRRLIVQAITSYVAESINQYDSTRFVQLKPEFAEVWDTIKLINELSVEMGHRNKAKIELNKATECMLKITNQLDNRKWPY